MHVFAAPWGTILVLSARCFCLAEVHCHLSVSAVAPSERPLGGCCLCVHGHQHFRSLPRAGVAGQPRNSCIKFHAGLSHIFDRLQSRHLSSRHFDKNGVWHFVSCDGCIRLLTAFQRCIISVGPQSDFVVTSRQFPSTSATSAVATLRCATPSVPKQKQTFVGVGTPGRPGEMAVFFGLHIFGGTHFIAPKFYAVRH